MQGLSLILASMLAPAVPPGTVTVSDFRGPIEDSWSQVAYQEDRDCEIEVTGSGNGKFFRISIRGLQPGEIGHFHLTNEDLHFDPFKMKMKPISYNFKSDGNGEFSKIYLPFRYGHYTTVVDVNVEGRQCDVSVAFPFTRIPPGQERFYD